MSTPAALPSRPLAITVLGSTGSIGCQTLEVIQALNDRFQVLGLAAGTRSHLLVEQARHFRPRYVATLGGPEVVAELRALGCEVVSAAELAALPEADLVMAAMAGQAGLAPTLAAIRAGKRVALANKETVVIAGSVIQREVRASGARILPVDSEPSAIWQCLLGEGLAPVLPHALVPLGRTEDGERGDGATERRRDGTTDDRRSTNPAEESGAYPQSHTPSDFRTLSPSSRRPFAPSPLLPVSLSRVILTASGGALRDLPIPELEHVTPERVLRHPTWSMGPKVTVDSASLMNKGLEVIEAHWLFGLRYDQIDVILHRESVVHSLVEFADGSFKAQLGPPDMRLPIQYALTYPERLPGAWPTLDLAGLGQLTFGPVDVARYPCLRLAIEAGRRGGTYPAVLSGADEAAVALFLAGKIRFNAVPTLVERVLGQHDAVAQPSLDEVLAAEAWASRLCQEQAQAI